MVADRKGDEMSDFMKVAERFFYEHAGYSYNPATESRDAGRRRCAAEMAAAERSAREAGIGFEWSEDSFDSSEWSDEQPPWTQYVCVAVSADGRVAASLGGIDFGRGGTPWTDARYRRVVEAELAAEALADAQEDAR